MADEAILREIPKPDKNFNPTGKSPAGGSTQSMAKFSPQWYAEKLLLEARQFLGWHQEYYKGGHNSNQSESAQPVTVSERETVSNFALPLHQRSSGPSPHLKA